jgi:DNA helicase HerA-like ATPase
VTSARDDSLRMLAELETFDREEFLTERWRYRCGEHVTILGPTGSGKTHLAYQLLERSATLRLPAVVLVMKPRDETVQTWTRRVGYRRVRSWPPVASIWQPSRPPGWVVWPKHTFDLDRDDAMLEGQFRRALMDSYKRGNRISFCDETAGLMDLGLKRELVAVWRRGRSMGNGIWAASQRPVDIPLDAYSQAEHLFLFHDPDKRARERFAEIGGVDPYLVQMANQRLGRHQALYIRRDGPRICVVDA